MSGINLQDRVAVVTGGGSGIGRATAVLLAMHGAKVFVGDRNLRLDENGELFARLSIVPQACDVREAEQIDSLVASAAAFAGGLDIVVNNAGIGLVKQLPKVSEAEWDACLDTNFKSAFLVCRRAIPELCRRGGGVIVNISSNAGLLPRAHDPVYSTSKGALISFTKSLALCHAPDRIRVNAVCPGPVGDTGMVNDDLDRAPDREAYARALIDASPLARAFGRMISPEEIAEAVLYLVSDQAAMVTGTCIAIDGGKSLGVPAQR